MKKIILSMLLLPLLTFAQAGDLTIGEISISYDDSTESEESVFYYKTDSLVASQHGDLWIVYENNLAVLEAHDTDRDGEADVFIEINQAGEVVEVVGENAEELRRPETVEFTELLDGAELEPVTLLSKEDLVGSLDSITIPSYHNYTRYVFIIIFLTGAVYWWYRRKNKSKREEE